MPPAHDRGATGAVVGPAVACTSDRAEARADGGGRCNGPSATPSGSSLTPAARRTLTATARAYGEHLRPVQRVGAGTCVVCGAPTTGHDHCYRCRADRARFGADLADATGFVTYAVDGAWSGRCLYDYKTSPPASEARHLVLALSWLAIADHRRCAEHLIGAAVTHWATVPSLPARARANPLRALVEHIPPAPREVVLRVDDPSRRRDTRRTHYAANALPPTGAHVLLLDDTWVAGGHAQSAALALRAAGAATISILCIGRWLDPRQDVTRSFLADGICAAGSVPTCCPWTGGTCPGLPA